MSSRTPSARLIAKRRAADAEAPTSSTAPTRPALKRQNVKKETSSKPRKDDFRKIKGRRGQLKIMTELPLDILLEIFGHLEPYDLLRVLCASKALRAIIIGDHSTSLWNKAYENVGRNNIQIKPPPCPPGATILRYTDFIFGRGCQFCKASKASNYHWSARARMCNKCTRTELLASYEMDENTSLNLTEEAGELCSVCYMWRPRSQNAILKRELDWHIRQLDQCIDDEARTRYKETRKVYLEENYKHTKAIKTWIEQYNYGLDCAREQILEKRQAFIVNKLKEAGYDPELGSPHISRIPGGALHAPLTEKGWEKIKAGFISVYEWQRQDKRKKAIISNFQTRMRKLTVLIEKTQEGLPKPWIYPPTSNIARREPFASVIEQNAEETSPDNLSLIDKLENRIPDLVKAWRDDADRFLLGLLQDKKDAMRDVDAADINRSPLELAATFFKCYCSCKEPISYPRILMHSCVWSHKIPDRDEDDGSREVSDEGEDDNDEDEDEAQEYKDPSVDNAEAHRSPNEVYGIPTTTTGGVWKKMSSWWGVSWNETDMIELDEEAVGFARAIVQACNEDPNTVTMAAMNEKDVRVECMRCVPRPGRRASRHVMTWKAAILHDIAYHFEETPTKTGWKLVTDASEIAQIHVLEEQAVVQRKLKPNSYSRIVTVTGNCGHCGERFENTIQDTTGRKSTWKKHICEGIDAPMNVYPYPVKL